jgi:uncharacterized membrane protein
MDKQELKRQCEALSDQELYLVVNNKRLYNEMIVTAAQIELKKRAVSKEDLKQFRAHDRKLNQTNIGDVEVDCRLIEKILFYFLCFPQMSLGISRDFIRQGYWLAARQGRYFGLCGFVGCLLSVTLGLSIHSFVIGLTTWVLGFAIAFLLNQFYFKRWFRERLARRKAATSNDPVS